MRLLFNMQGVVISLTHIMLPFAIFPIYSVLGKLDALAQGGGAGPRCRPVGDLLARDAAADAPGSWPRAA